MLLETESAKPLLKLLEFLTVDNVYRLYALKFMHSWHKGNLPKIFNDTFKYANNIHGYNTRYSAQKNFYKPKVRTNVGKQSIAFQGIDIWKDLPSAIKNSASTLFPKLAKHYLLYKQEN